MTLLDLYQRSTCSSLEDSRACEFAVPLVLKNNPNCYILNLRSERFKPDGKLRRRPEFGK